MSDREENTRLLVDHDDDENEVETHQIRSPPAKQPLRNSIKYISLSTLLFAISTFGLSLAIIIILKTIPTNGYSSSVEHLAVALVIISFIAFAYSLVSVLLPAIPSWLNIPIEFTLIVVLFVFSLKIPRELPDTYWCRRYEWDPETGRGHYTKETPECLAGIRLETTLMVVAMAVAIITAVLLIVLIILRVTAAYKAKAWNRSFSGLPWSMPVGEMSFEFTVRFNKGQPNERVTGVSGSMGVQGRQGVLVEGV